MISAFKRLVKPADTSAGSTTATATAVNNNNLSTHESDNHSNSPNRNKGGLNVNFLNNGVQMISQSLQKKFSKGVNYNMKIVIKGDYNVGKTTIWLRLQGEPFKEQYESSDEIKVANINWNYKLTDDVVKVEVWDVVDRSKKKRSSGGGGGGVGGSGSGSGGGAQQSSQSVGLKLDNNANNSKQPSAASVASLEPSLDAEFIDVYKNAHGCIMVYDITKPWTWDYVERELPKVPAHLPVLVVGNHRDMHHHRTIDELKCKFFLESLNRGSLGSTVRYTETSMRTGFGLDYLYKFFNIPFLQLRRENLMQQLEINAREMDNICEELNNMEEHIDDDYAAFSDRLNTQRRAQQEANAHEALKNAKSVDEARRVAAEREAAAKAAAEQAEQNDPKKLIINQLMTKVIPAQVAAAAQPQQISMSVTIDPSNKNAAAAAAAAIVNNNSTAKAGSSVKNSLSLNEINGKQQKQQPVGPISKSPLNLKFSDTQDDEFNRFLEDKTPTSNQPQTASSNVTQREDDDDDNGKNPMVAAFKETLDSSDEDVNKLSKKLSTIPASFDNGEEPDVEEDTQNNRQSHVEEASDLPKPILPSLVSIDELSLTSSTADKPSNNDNNQQIHLNNEDFAFLESLTSSVSSKPALDDENGTATTTKKTKGKAKETNNVKKKSSKKTSGGGNKSSETESVDSKASHSKKKKSDKPKKSTSKSSTKTEAKSYYEDEDENSNNVYIKKDIDYEEL